MADDEALRTLNFEMTLENDWKDQVKRFEEGKVQWGRSQLLVEAGMEVYYFNPNLYHMVVNRQRNWHLRMARPHMGRRAFRRLRAELKRNNK